MRGVADNRWAKAISRTLPRYRRKQLRLRVRDSYVRKPGYAAYQIDAKRRRSETRLKVRSRRVARHQLFGVTPQPMSSWIPTLLRCFQRRLPLCDLVLQWRAGA